MTDARAAGEQVEVLVDPSAPQSRAAGEQVEAVVVPAEALRTRRVAAEAVEVLIRAFNGIHTVGAPTEVVQIKVSDGSWHRLQRMP